VHLNGYLKEQNQNLRVIPSEQNREETDSLEKPKRILSLNLQIGFVRWYRVAFGQNQSK